jgi:hypothetical protein
MSANEQIRNPPYIKVELTDMPWLSATEIGPLIEKLPSPESLVNCYAASEYLEKAFYSEGFKPTQVWQDAVVLSRGGVEVARSIRDSGIDLAPPLLNFTLFRMFYFHDLLVDYERSNFPAVLEELRNMQKSGDATWPYVFGHCLYHKFNDNYAGNRTAHLEAKDVQELLRGTPSGVFQIGTLLAGPLGFLASREKRYTPPTLALPLWHCSDLGCQARHLVEVRQFDSQQLAAYRTIWRLLNDRSGPASQWGGQLERLASNGNQPSGRPYADMPALIGDCVVGTELPALLKAALRSHSGQALRDGLALATGMRGSPDDLAVRLSREEMQQLILMLPDIEIVRFLDDLIVLREIDIPPSELRGAKTYALMHHFDGRSQLSCLGARSTNHPPIVQLYAEICNTYQKLGLADELVWRVRQGNSSSLEHAVMDFIRTKGPEAAVKELIFPTKSVTTAIGDGLFFQIRESETQDEACGRFLWKLGFSVPRYGDEYQILRNRIAEFKAAVLQVPPRLTEENRARIRSVGVNLFVSVEKFLTDLLTFNVWLLASDHFASTNFTYTAQDAIKSVAMVLGSEIARGNQVLSWRVDGENALGTLLGYLAEFRKWLKARQDADKSEVKRKDEDYPHYAEDTFWTFPFAHVELWADVPPPVLALYIETIESISTQLEQAELASIRNGLDHNRDEAGFPAPDKMLASVSRLEQVLDLADSRRVIPKLYWRVFESRDLHGQVADSFRDYRNGTFELWGPSPVLGPDRGVFGVPYLIAPVDFLNIPNSTLMFRASPKTRWREYWKDYPRRRFIPPESASVEAVVSADASPGASEEIHSLDNRD